MPSLSLLHLLHPRMHLWMIFKNFTSRRFNFNWHREQDVNLEVGSDFVGRQSMLLSIFWCSAALSLWEAPIAALSLKYINHPAIILFYAPLYTEGEDFPHFLHYNTDLCPSTPPARRLAKDGGWGVARQRLSIWVLFLSIFTSLSTYPLSPFDWDLDFSPGANNIDNDPFSACHL